MPWATAVEPLWDREREWTRRLAIVRSARAFVYTSTFYIEYDDYGRAFLEALADAQARGVAVHLLIDGFGQRLGGVLMTASARAALRRLLQELQAAGADVRHYRPTRAAGRWLGGGHHVKIQVSDAGEAIFGSSNLTRQSFEGWNEYAVRLTGPVVRTLLQCYAALGAPVSAAHLAALGDEDVQPPDAIPVDVWLCDPNQLQGPLGPLGWAGPNPLTERLRAMIDAARTSIAMTSFYFKPVDAIIEALVRAAERGVAIEVHHSHLDALPATELAWIAAAAHYRRLLGAGITIYENRRGEHSKILLVDDAWVACGSYNFEHAAHDRLAEAMLASRHPALVAPARAIIEELRGLAWNERVTHASLEALPLRLRVKQRVLGPFKRWM